MLIELYLPWPPSVNNYYAHTRNGIYIKKQGKRYRKQAEQAVNEQCSGVAQLPLGELLHVEVLLSPPNNRKCDLDNYMKCLLDALTEAGMWADDSIIDQLFIRRASKCSEGMVYVVISEAEPTLPPSFMIKHLYQNRK